MFGALLNGLLYRNIGKSSRKIKQNKKNFASNETTIAKTALVTSNHNALNFAHINIYPSCNIMPKLANTNATRKCNKLAKEDSSADSSQTKASHNTTTTRIFAGVPQKVDNVLEDAMYGSIKSILIVGGYVTLFYLLISMLSDYQILKILAYPVQVILGLFHIDPAIGLAIASGAFEMTSGCLDLSLAAIPINAVAPALSFIIGFGGISVFMQAYTFLKSFDMSAGKFFLMKFSQGILSMLCCMAFVFML